MLTAAQQALANDFIRATPECWLVSDGVRALPAYVRAALRDAIQSDAAIGHRRRAWRDEGYVMAGPDVPCIWTISYLSEHGDVVIDPTGGVDRLLVVQTLWEQGDLRTQFSVGFDNPADLDPNA